MFSTILTDFGTFPISFPHWKRWGTRTGHPHSLQPATLMLCNIFVNCSFEDTHRSVTPFIGPLEPVTNADVISKTSKASTGSKLRLLALKLLSILPQLPPQSYPDGTRGQGSMKGCPSADCRVLQPHQAAQNLSSIRPSA